MGLKTQHKDDIGRDSIAYYNRHDSIIQISLIHTTYRKHHLIPVQPAMLWDKFFCPIWINRMSIPDSRDAFEEWIKDKIHELSVLIGAEDTLEIGKAQKFLNAFLKELWAFEEVKGEVSALFHIPLDRMILEQFRERPDTWKSWTKVIVASNTEFDCRYAEYLRMQEAFRLHTRAVSAYMATEPLLCPLDLEQLLRQRIDIEPGS